MFQSPRTLSPTPSAEVRGYFITVEPIVHVIKPCLKTFSNVNVYDILNLFCCVCMHGRVAMTWGSALFRDPPVRAPSALRSITAITTYPLYPSRPSTSTDQVSQMKWSKSSLHRIPAECMDERDLLVASHGLFLLSVSSWAFFLPLLLMCAPSVLFFPSFYSSVPPSWAAGRNAEALLLFAQQRHAPYLPLQTSLPPP